MQHLFPPSNTSFISNISPRRPTAFEHCARRITYVAPYDSTSHHFSLDTRRSRQPSMTDISNSIYNFNIFSTSYSYNCMTMRIQPFQPSTTLPTIYNKWDKPKASYIN